MLAVSQEHFRLATKLVDRHELGLRAGDALHLAIVSDHGATVHTLDQRLAAASVALGTPAQLITM